MCITKIFGKLLQNVGLLVVNLSRQLYLSPEEKKYAPWAKAQGDKTLRLDYQLNNKSLVFDLGGYEGQWASDIFARYCCTIHVFEPVPIFAERIVNRFEANPNITVHNYGLGKEDCNVQLYLFADGSSVINKKSAETITIRIAKIDDFIRENKFTIIDLMKINIEGCEYELLEHLLEIGCVENILNIQVQFHDCVQNANGRMQAIQRQLVKTHHLTYQYPFVWENWTRN